GENGYSGPPALAQSAASLMIAPREPTGRKIAPGEELHSNGFLVFLLIAGLAGAVAATVGTFSLKIAGDIFEQQGGITWLTWWLGDTTGIVLITPWLLAWGRGGVPRTMPHRFAEGVALFLLLLLTEQFIFGEHPSPPILRYPYFLLIFLIWGRCASGYAW
ncbi:MAG: MASE1 domain-containing protein, partial [Armatimonadota bacterium]